MGRERGEGVTATTRVQRRDHNTCVLINEIADSLSDEDFGVFHGPEFTSIRENGQLTPDSTASQQYLDGKKTVILAYNEDINEIAVIPLEKDYDHTNVYSNGVLTNYCEISQNTIFPSEPYRQVPIATGQ